MSTSGPALPTHPIPRELLDVARERLSGFPVLTITGPRQSGKTTLSRLLAPDLPYFSLEDPDVRAFAIEDPRAFLRQVSDGAILDEVQRAPDLFSYLQGIVDADRRMGRFILTGSSQFELMESITQTLAGRASMLTLHPFSLTELQAVDRAPDSVDDLLYSGEVMIFNYTRTAARCSLRIPHSIRVAGRKENQRSFKQSHEQNHGSEDCERCGNTTRRHRERAPSSVTLSTVTPVAALTHQMA